MGYLLITMGFALFVIHMLCSLTIQRRLRRAGKWRWRIQGLKSVYDIPRTYVGLARRYHWSPVLGYISPTFLAMGIILIFAGVMRTPR